MSTEDYLIPIPSRPMTAGRRGFRDREAEELVAGLAHNLRNLVQVVNGNLELIAARTDDELLLRYLANAQSAAKLMTELASGLEEHLDDQPSD